MDFGLAHQVIKLIPVHHQENVSGNVHCECIPHLLISGCKINDDTQNYQRDFSYWIQHEMDGSKLLKYDFIHANANGLVVGGKKYFFSQCKFSRVKLNAQLLMYNFFSFKVTPS